MKYQIELLYSINSYHSLVDKYNIQIYLNIYDKRI